MSEFKFACPVCGQHITAARESSGTQIECPTCFQKIVVPQARSGDSKFILSAAQVDKPRPPQVALQESSPVIHRSRGPAIRGLVIVVLIVAAGVGLYTFRSKLGLVKAPPPQSTNSLPAEPPENPAAKMWTMDLDKAGIPDSEVTGMIHGQSFTLTRVTLQGGNLSVRQGAGWPPELAVAILFPAKHGEELSGKSVRIAASQIPPRPKVVLRWKDEQGQPESRTFVDGYALIVDFGQAANGRMPGKLYIALPDDEKSVLAGTFNAEIRAPEQRKKKAPSKNLTGMP